MSSSSRHLSRWFFVVAALLGTSSFAQSGLHALTCIGAQDMAFSPGLKLLPANVTLTATTLLDTCWSLEPDITSGTFQVESTSNASCARGSFQDEILITWNTGETSTISLNTPVEVRPLSPSGTTAYGTVTAGRFEGSLVATTMQSIPGDRDLLNCLTGGLTQGLGVVSVSILNVQP
ncbi:hypothetical protein LZ198_13535 [Myxococcus sp. K15C18031901]|uniref:hypothetical protein n=1 Tax=Myxococcus dinghuensis TaxID=2906761 RepID=UPI0020A75489|nr:hypothetical protein [Myxococcus dinghuensis]MCP3099892.1 hypothetical protein [Myxococcus dinghuensis]